MQNFVDKYTRIELQALKPYVPGKPIDEVKRELGIDDIIKLASNENPLGPSPLAVDALGGVLRDLHLYPDANCYYLKSKISSLTDIDSSGVLIGNGSDELLKLMAETFISKGDQVILGSPSFSEYEFAAKIMGAECIKVPLKDFKHDLDAMLSAISDRTRMVFICNPNNPSGTIVDADEIDRFMSAVPEHVLVVFDEAYIEYVESDNFVSGLRYVKEGKNAIVFRTFSKIYGLAALRIGYGLTTPAIAAAIEKVTEPFNVNMLAQVAALAALDDNEHVHKSQDTNSKGKKYLYKELEQMGLSYVATEANFIFLDTGTDCQKVFKELMAMGVIIRTGDIFGYPSYIRVTVGSPDENERFILSLKKVLAK